MSSSRPDTAATFTHAREATTYDNLLLDGRISNADVRRDYDGRSGLHDIPETGAMYKGIDTDMLLSYLLTCDPPEDVNGSDTGIGTGWSTKIPTYNPRDIIANLRLIIAGEQPNMLIPWFRGFMGTIEEKTGKDAGNYTVSGIAEMVAEDRVVISELPIGKWTTDYKQMLETMLIGNVTSADKKEDGTVIAPVATFIKDFKENHTDTSVLFSLTIPNEKINEINAEKGGLHKRLKLDSSI